MENAEYVCCVMKIKEREILMELDQIMQMLNGKTEIKLVKFISDKGPNSCEDCLKHHGEVFQLDDPEKPELPIHPNCRCKYELLTPNEVASYQGEVQKIKTELINYGNQIAAQAVQLLSECEKEIKTHTVTHTANAVVTALPAVYQTMKVIEKGKALEEQVSSTVASAKLTAMTTALQITMTAMQKINQAAEVVHKEMEKAGIFEFAREFNSWLNIGEELKNYLKNLHYNRLALREQQLHVLPKSPEEAIKQGFVKAPDSQNVYHQNKGQTGNEKYLHPKTGQEVIFNTHGKIVTDPENIGTKNYGTNPISINHIFLDILPYYLWGNSPDDTTSFYDRVFGPYWGRKLRNYPYPENFLEDMEKELDEILKKYRKYQKSY